VNVAGAISGKIDFEVKMILEVTEKKVNLLFYEVVT
jgi:hypothetical protein